MNMSASFKRLGSANVATRQGRAKTDKAGEERAAGRGGHMMPPTTRKRLPCTKRSMPRFARTRTKQREVLRPPRSTRYFPNSFCLSWFSIYFRPFLLMYNIIAKEKKGRQKNLNQCQTQQNYRGSRRYSRGHRRHLVVDGKQEHDRFPCFVRNHSLPCKHRRHNRRPCRTPRQRRAVPRSQAVIPT